MSAFVGLLFLWWGTNWKVFLGVTLILAEYDKHKKPEPWTSKKQPNL